MLPIFDIAIIGAGAIGSAIARELARYDLKIVLLEANPDVGMGTSKASTAIWHTGFDAKPGSLEARLMRRSYALMERFMPEAGIPYERLGAILLAWNQEQLDSLPVLLRKAHENGVTDVEIISAAEIRRREPHINPNVLGGLWVPGEGILCTYSVPLACVTQAVLNGVVLRTNFRVSHIEAEGDFYRIIPTSPHPFDNPQDKPSTALEQGYLRSQVHSCSAQDAEPVGARWVINAAGLYSDEINALFGHWAFTVTPRRGQLIVYDKLARPLVNHVLLPVPTAKTKGVLISPTVYGNILLGPTAEDLPDKTATQTTAEGLEMLIRRGREILPQLLEEEVTATYSGLRAATEHSDYQIELHAAQRYLCVGGIRSTGISAGLGIAEYVGDLLQGAGLKLTPRDEFKPIKMPYIGQAGVRPYQNAELIANDPAYGEIICHCERVSRGEVRDALTAPIPAPNLDGLRRRTRAIQGRCQGFNCHAALVQSLEENFITKDTQEYEGKTFGNLGGQKNVEVVIVGAGPAGLAAAIELKKQGIRDVLVVDREAEAGGIPRFCEHPGFGRADLRRFLTGPQYAEVYRDRAEKAGVEIQASTTVTGWGNSNGLSFTSPNGLGEIEAQAVLLATGVRERPRAARLIPGTRPQGVFTTGSLQRFVQAGLPVGKRAVIVGAELVSLSALMTLYHAGVKCVGMVTEHPRHQLYFPYLPMKWVLADVLTRTPIMTNARVTNIFGQKRVDGVEITCAPKLRKSSETSEVLKVECDTVVFTGAWIPEHELARLGGLVMDEGTRGPLVAGFCTSRVGVFAAGNLLRGAAPADACALEGQGAARQIARFLKDDRWPQTPRKIRVESPLIWVCPNAVDPLESGRFQFQSQEFRKRVCLQVVQGEAVLYQQTLRLLVNEMMEFPGDWTKKVDVKGEDVWVRIVE
ncbi:MAG: hypothetical protein Fur0022_11490 [Anaerolineales bacterium]